VILVRRGVALRVRAGSPRPVARFALDRLPVSQHDPFEAWNGRVA
jgi:hypothetical protein